MIGGGTPLADAVAFRQWAAARRLVERGATVELHHAAALGMMDAVRAGLAAAPPQDARDLALVYAAHGGRADAAELLLEAGADPRWTAPWDGGTAADAADAAGQPGLAARLRAAG